jgi:Flp pilus assembly pilin Flp
MMGRFFAALRPRFRLMAAPTVAVASCRRGATAVEYGLIAALVVIGLISVLKVTGGSLAGLPLQRVVDTLTAMIS